MSKGEAALRGLVDNIVLISGRAVTSYGRKRGVDLTPDLTRLSSRTWSTLPRKVSPGYKTRVGELLAGGLQVYGFCNLNLLKYSAYYTVS